MIAYHVTSLANLPAIREQGLEPRDTAEHNHPGTRLPGKAVWLFVNRDHALSWAATFVDRGPQAVLGVLMMNVEELERDPVLESGRYYRWTVPAWRIDVRVLVVSEEAA